MVFSSLEFLFVFMPVFFALYYLVPQRVRPLCLLVANLAFYTYGSWGKPLYLLLFAASLVVNWLLGRRIGRGTHRKGWLIAGLVYNFGWLFVFKYAEFLFSSVQAVLNSVFPTAGITLPAMELALPLGISFYTFQIVSYLVDVYTKSAPAQRSLVRFSGHLYLFPQLISGPISEYSQMAPQFARPNITLARVDEGLKDFTFGLGLKVLLANRIGKLWTDVTDIGFDSITTPLAWMGIIAFSMQLYFDFYGYSRMAVGLGKMMGFDLPENFRHPYMALSMTDFWRRWHISLGLWFRKYVYIPLGGNRKGKARTIRNLLVVWLFTGLWHGASWNFVVWGLLLFGLIVLEKFAIKPTLERFPLLGHAYMLLVIPLSWLVFAVTDFGELGLYLSRLFPFLPGETVNVFAGDWLMHGKTYGGFLAVGLLFCTPLPEKLYQRFKNTVCGSLVLLAVFWAAVYFVYMGLNDPFMYFQF